jgi:hypothetical protein
MDVTDEMRQAVAEEQCRAVGHSYDAVQQFSTGEPVAFICSNCTGAGTSSPTRKVQ